MNYIMGDFECKTKKFKFNSLGRAYGMIRQEGLGCLHRGKPVACNCVVLRAIPGAWKMQVVMERRNQMWDVLEAEGTTREVQSNRKREV